jgi:hypothetical protein
VFIEVHHIVPEKDGGTDEEDNAIPLCFDCHAKVSHYDSTQPIGTKFKPEELKKRRDQVYDECTRNLVPVLQYQVHANGRVLPMVGFTLIHKGGQAPAVQATVNLKIFINGVGIDYPYYGLYGGQYRWNLNPGEGVNGQFMLPPEAMEHGADVRVGIYITVFDVYDRPHKLLPVAYVLMEDRANWYLDPMDPTMSAAQGRR